MIAFILYYTYYIHTVIIFMIAFILYYTYYIHTVIMFPIYNSCPAPRVSTLDEDGRELRADVLGDPQGVPGVHGPVGEHYPAGADVVASVALIGLSHGLGQRLCTDAVELGTLLQVVPEEGRGSQHTQLVLSVRG